MGRLQIVIGSVSERLERERRTLAHYLSKQYTDGTVQPIFIAQAVDGHTPVDQVSQRVLDREKTGLYVGFVTVHMNDDSIDGKECVFSYGRARELNIPVLLFLKNGAEQKKSLDVLVGRARADPSEAVAVIPYRTVANLGPALTRYCFGENSGNSPEERAVGI